MATGTVDLVTETTAQEILKAAKQRNALLQVIASDKMSEVVTDIKGIQQLVRNGLAPELLNIGDQIIVPWQDVAANKSYDVPLDIVHFGEVELKDGERVPGMYLQWHYATPFACEFDNFEALYYAEEELPAGTYCFTISTTWSKAEAGTYQFTLTQPVPAGGQIAGLQGIADVEYTSTSWTVSTYASKSSGSAIETVSVTKGSNGTNLGNLVKEGSGNLNSIQRVGYGYNRWSQSAYRQFLNSNKAAGEWWKPQNNFDRPPSIAATKAGFLSGFEEDFLSAIGEIRVTTALNTITDSGEGTQEDTYDKFFLPALEQIYVVPQLSGVEGEYWEYWKRAVGASSPQAQYGTYPERITYGIDNKSAAQYVRLRSANRGNAYTVWNVYTSGYVSTSNACNAHRCAPACVIC